MSSDERRGLIVVVAATLVLGAVFAYPRGWSQGLLGPDEFWHADLSRHLVEGNGYRSSAIFPMDARRAVEFPAPEPLKQSGYSLVVALVWRIFGVSERAMVAVALFAFVGAMGLVYWQATASLRSWRWGMGVAAVTLCNPIMLSKNTDPLPTSMFFALFTLTLVLLLRPSVRRVVAAGVVLAAATATKGYGILYLPLVALFLVGVRRDRWRLPILFVATFFLTLVLGSILLPEGSVRLFNSSGNYALSILHEWRYSATEAPFNDLDPPDPIASVLEDPVGYGARLVRFAARTKLMLDLLAGPAIGPLLLPLLVLAVSMALADAHPWSRRILPEPSTNASPQDRARTLLWTGAICVTLPFFWVTYLRVHYLSHLFPTMLVLIAASLRRLELRIQAPRAMVQGIVAAALVWLVAYPAARAIWDVYRDDTRFGGRNWNVRVVSREAIEATVARHVPGGGVIVTDMQDEVSWLTGHPTIAFPINDAQLRFLIARFDVAAIYERPERRRDWPVLREEFELVESRPGRLWLRRASPPIDPGP